MSTVSGDLIIPEGVETVSAAQVVVRVRDITYSDAPAVQPVAPSMAAAS